jgi:glycosyltransferase domain-containing protein
MKLDSKMTSSELGRLTVIIPTISRPMFVMRQISYWSELEAQVRIIDGALSPIDLSRVEPLPENIKYLHQPSRFNDRLAAASSLIETEFACLLPDDEFFLPTGLTACIRHLDLHPQQIGAVGKVLQFFVDQGVFKAFQDYDYWKNFDPELSGTSEGRLRQVLPPNKTHKIQFAVLRREVWAEIFQTSYRDFYSTGYLYERMLNLYAAVIGESVVLNTLLWMRSMENPPISSDAVPRDDRGGMVGWADDPNMKSEVEHYFEKVRHIISQGDGVSVERADEYARQFVFGGIEVHRQKIQRTKRKVWRRIALKIVAVAPKELKRWAKRNVSVQILKGFDWKGYPLEQVTNQLEERGIEFSISELKKVEELALQLDALR